MFWGIFAFELRYQLRRHWCWLTFVTIAAIVFLTTKSAPVDDATYASTWINSSFTIAMNTVIGCLIWLLVAAPIAGEAAARDSATRMQPLTHTAPVSKRDYLGGRFLAALVLNALTMLSVSAGVLLAAYRPGVPDAFVGPFRIEAFAYPYLIIVLPNILLTTAVQFGIATWTRRPVSAYLGSLLVFFIAYVLGLILAVALRNPELSKLLDPIGPFFIFGELPEGWTAIEKNTRLLTLSGTLLKNRLMWSAVAVSVIAVTYARFQFSHRIVRPSWWSRLKRANTAQQADSVAVPARSSGDAVTAIVARRGEQQFGLASSLGQMLAIARASFGTLLRMRGGLDVLLFVSLLIVVVMPLNLEIAGVPIVPRAERVLRDLAVPLANFATPFVFIPLLIIHWAGELVWRERDAGIAEIVDASPVSHWTLMLGKLSALALIIATFMALLTAAGILVQIITGQANLDLPRYVQVLFGFQFVEYFLFAMLAFAVHSIASQKYLGYLLAVVLFGLIVISPLIGVEHRMLVFGASPAWSYTQMRGYGASVAPWIWFKLYWGAWALMLSIAIALLWARGKEDGVRERLRIAADRFTPTVRKLSMAAVALLVAVGGFVFYNTNLLHRYVTLDEDTRIRAEYERAYSPVKYAAKPEIAATSVRIEIYPEQRRAELQGMYLLVNRETVAVDSIYIAPAASVRLKSFEFEAPATLVVNDEEHLTRVYQLAQPLQPGDSMRVNFALEFASRGFTNGGVSTAVLHNGTQIKLSEWLPGIGYQPSREVIRPRDRVEYGLAERPVIPVLEDEAARYHIGQRSTFEAIIGTSEEQTAVAPGALLRSWPENGRRYFHYRSDVPVGGELPVLSAAYAVRQETFEPKDGSKPIDIRIHYHPPHASIVDNVLRGVRATLEYGTTHFGPYPYAHVTVSERSAGGLGLNAESGNVDYSEQFTMLAPEKNPSAFDFAVAVLGHEMGHNFGVPIAAVEGAPIMSESFAWYTAMGVMEEAYGREKLVRMLSWMHQPYPHRPVKTGAPLIRALDPWSGYRRGPFALFALREYLGEEQVSTAIRRLRENHSAPNAAAATTLDLHRELEAVTPDSMKYLLHDLFTANTFWSLGVVGSAEPGEGERWDVTLEITARKFTVDSAGKETDVPMNDLVDVGVFASPNQMVPTDPLYFERRRLRSGRQTITVTVARKPARVGVDPYQLLLDLDANDNWEGIRIVP